MKVLVKNFDISGAGGLRKTDTLDESYLFRQ